MASITPRVVWLAGLLFIACNAYSHPGEQEQLARLNHYIAQQPNEQALYIRRASLYSTGGHFEEAAADLARAETLGPPVAVALERGLLHQRRGETGLAIAAFGRYIETFPDAAIAYEYRARAYREAGDKPKAVADLRRYIALQENPHPGIYLAAADLLHELRDTDQAIALLDQGLAQLGPVPTLQRRAIELLRAQGNTADAIARLETLRIPLRESPGWKLEMATLLVEDGRAADAQLLVAGIEVDLGERRSTPANLAALEKSRELKNIIAALEGTDNP